jgi:hypothetical protein
MTKKRRSLIFDLSYALASLFMVVCINNCCPDISGNWDISESVEAIYPDPVCNSSVVFPGVVAIAQPQCMQVPCEFAYAGVIDTGGLQVAAVGTGTIDQAGQIALLSGLGLEFEGCTTTGTGTGTYDEQTETMYWDASGTMTCPDVCAGMTGNVTAHVDFWRP